MLLAFLIHLFLSFCDIEKIDIYKVDNLANTISQRLVELASLIPTNEIQKLYETQTYVYDPPVGYQPFYHHYLADFLSPNTPLSFATAVFDEMINACNSAYVNYTAAEHYTNITGDFFPTDDSFNPYAAFQLMGKPLSNAISYRIQKVVIAARSILSSFKRNLEAALVLDSQWLEDSSRFMEIVKQGLEIQESLNEDLTGLSDAIDWNSVMAALEQDTNRLLFFGNTISILPNLTSLPNNLDLLCVEDLLSASDAPFRFLDNYNSNYEAVAPLNRLHKTLDEQTWSPSSITFPSPEHSFTITTNSKYKLFQSVRLYKDAGSSLHRARDLRTLVQSIEQTLDSSLGNLLTLERSYLTDFDPSNILSFRGASGLVVDYNFIPKELTDMKELRSYDQSPDMTFSGSFSTRPKRFLIVVDTSASMGKYKKTILELVSGFLYSTLTDRDLMGFVKMGSLPQYVDGFGSALVAFSEKALNFALSDLEKIEYFGISDVESGIETAYNMLMFSSVLNLPNFYLNLENNQGTYISESYIVIFSDGVAPSVISSKIVHMTQIMKFKTLFFHFSTNYEQKKVFSEVVQTIGNFASLPFFPNSPISNGEMKIGANGMGGVIPVPINASFEDLYFPVRGLLSSFDFVTFSDPTVDENVGNFFLSQWGNTNHAGIEISTPIRDFGTTGEGIGLDYNLSCTNSGSRSSRPILRGIASIRIETNPSRFSPLSLSYGDFTFVLSNSGKILQHPGIGIVRPFLEEEPNFNSITAPNAFNFQPFSSCLSLEHVIPKNLLYGWVSNTVLDEYSTSATKLFKNIYGTRYSQTVNGDTITKKGVPFFYYSPVDMLREILNSDEEERTLDGSRSFRTLLQSTRPVCGRYESMMTLTSPSVVTVTTTQNLPVSHFESWSHNLVIATIISEENALRRTFLTPKNVCSEIEKINIEAMDFSVFEESSTKISEKPTTILDLTTDEFEHPSVSWWLGLDPYIGGLTEDFVKPLTQRYDPDSKTLSISNSTFCYYQPEFSNQNHTGIQFSLLEALENITKFQFEENLDFSSYKSEAFDYFYEFLSSGNSTDFVFNQISRSSLKNVKEILPFPTDELFPVFQLASELFQISESIPRSTLKKNNLKNVHEGITCPTNGSEILRLSFLSESDNSSLPEYFVSALVDSLFDYLPELSISGTIQKILEMSLGVATNSISSYSRMSFTPTRPFFNNLEHTTFWEYFNPPSDIPKNQFHHEYNIIHSKTTNSSILDKIIKNNLIHSSNFSEEAILALQILEASSLEIIHNPSLEIYYPVATDFKHGFFRGPGLRLFSHIDPYFITSIQKSPDTTIYASPPKFRQTNNDNFTSFISFYKPVFNLQRRIDLVPTLEGVASIDLDLDNELDIFDVFNEKSLAEIDVDITFLAIVDDNLNIHAYRNIDTDYNPLKTLKDKILNLLTKNSDLIDSDILDNLLQCETNNTGINCEWGKLSVLFPSFSLQLPVVEPIFSEALLKDGIITQITTSEGQRMNTHTISYHINTVFQDYRGDFPGTKSFQFTNNSYPIFSGSIHSLCVRSGTWYLRKIQKSNLWIIIAENYIEEPTDYKLCLMNNGGTEYYESIDTFDYLFQIDFLSPVPPVNQYISYGNSLSSDDSCFISKIYFGYDCTHFVLFPLFVFAAMSLFVFTTFLVLYNLIVYKKAKQFKAIKMKNHQDIFFKTKSMIDFILQFKTPKNYLISTSPIDSNPLAFSFFCNFHQNVKTKKIIDGHSDEAQSDEFFSDDLKDHNQLYWLNSEAATLRHDKKSVFATIMTDQDVSSFPIIQKAPSVLLKQSVYRTADFTKSKKFEIPISSPSFIRFPTIPSRSVSFDIETSECEIEPASDIFPQMDTPNFVPELGSCIVCKDPVLFNCESEVHSAVDEPIVEHVEGSFEHPWYPSNFSECDASEICWTENNVNILTSFRPFEVGPSFCAVLQRSKFGIRLLKDLSTIQTKHLRDMKFTRHWPNAQMEAKDIKSRKAISNIVIPFPLTLPSQSYKFPIIPVFSETLIPDLTKKTSQSEETETDPEIPYLTSFPHSHHDTLVKFEDMKRFHSVIHTSMYEAAQVLASNFANGSFPKNYMVKRQLRNTPQLVPLNLSQYLFEKYKREFVTQNLSLKKSLRYLYQSIVENMLRERFSAPNYLNYTFHKKISQKTKKPPKHFRTNSSQYYSSSSDDYLGNEYHLNNFANKKLDYMLGEYYKRNNSTAVLQQQIHDMQVHQRKHAVKTMMEIRKVLIGKRTTNRQLFTRIDPALMSKRDFGYLQFHLKRSSRFKTLMKTRILPGHVKLPPSELLMENRSIYEQWNTIQDTNDVTPPPLEGYHWSIYSGLYRERPVSAPPSTHMRKLSKVKCKKLRTFLSLKVSQKQNPRTNATEAQKFISLKDERKDCTPVQIAYDHTQAHVTHASNVSLKQKNSLIHSTELVDKKKGAADHNRERGSPSKRQQKINRSTTFSRRRKQHSPHPPVVNHTKSTVSSLEKDDSDSLVKFTHEPQRGRQHANTKDEKKVSNNLISKHRSQFLINTSTDISSSSTRVLFRSNFFSEINSKNTKNDEELGPEPKLVVMGDQTFSGYSPSEETAPSGLRGRYDKELGPEPKLVVMGDQTFSGYSPSEESNSKIPAKHYPQTNIFTQTMVKTPMRFSITPETDFTLSSSHNQHQFRYEMGSTLTGSTPFSTARRDISQENTNQNKSINSVQTDQIFRKEILDKKPVLQSAVKPPRIPKTESAQRQVILPPFKPDAPLKLSLAQKHRGSLFRQFHSNDKNSMNFRQLLEFVVPSSISREHCFPKELQNNTLEFPFKYSSKVQIINAKTLPLSIPRCTTTLDLFPKESTSELSFYGRSPKRKKVFDFMNNEFSFRARQPSRKRRPASWLSKVRKTVVVDLSQLAFEAHHFAERLIDKNIPPVRTIELEAYDLYKSHKLPPPPMIRISQNVLAPVTNHIPFSGPFDGPVSAFVQPAMQQGAARESPESWYDFVSDVHLCEIDREKEQMIRRIKQEYSERTGQQISDEKAFDVIYLVAALRIYEEAVDATLFLLDGGLPPEEEPRKQNNIDELPFGRIIRILESIFYEKSKADTEDITWEMLLALLQKSDKISPSLLRYLAREGRNASTAKYAAIRSLALKEQAIKEKHRKSKKVSRPFAVTDGYVDLRKLRQLSVLARKFEESCDLPSRTALVGYPALLALAQKMLLPKHGSAATEEKN